MEDSPKNNINIQLGDILNFNAPENLLYDNKQLYVKYIDINKIILVNIDNNELSTLRLIDGQLEDNTIDSIDLLSRSDDSGYARQNDLLPGTWINIYFNSVVPFILTGEITNLEEDMIEIKTYPNNETIYIDFEYKGIPESIPIEKIVIRDSPSKQKEIKELSELQSEPVAPLYMQESEQVIDNATVEITPAYLNEIILDADQLIMGEKLDDLIQYVDVDESEMRYSINKQTNDLLDELLADIPNYKRTPDVLNKIHKLIERYLQLRSMFSKFDANGNPNKPDIIDKSFKPIIENILNLNEKFAWLLPVSQNKKKLYDIDDEIESIAEINDIDNINLVKSLEKQANIIDTYKNSNVLEENKYLYLFKSLNEFYTPFTDSQYPEHAITNQVVKDNILTMTNNLGDLYSTVADNTKGQINRKQYYFDTYIKNLTYLKDNKITNIAPNDTINIISFIILPLQLLLYSQINLPTTNILNQIELNNVDLDYWKIFNNNKKLRSIIVDNLSQDGNYTKEFIKGIQSNIITEFKLSEDLWDDQDKYHTYLDNIIPTNDDILNLFNNILKNNYSIHSIIKFLDILKIQQNDITYELYSKINDIVEENITSYKKSYLANHKQVNKQINKLNLQSKSTPYVPNLFRLFELSESLEMNKSLKTIVFDTYGFDPNIVYSDSEILNIIFKIDSGKLFTNSIIKLDLDLQTSKLVDSFVKKYEQLILEKKRLSNNCKVIAKKYTSIHSLLADSQKPIYFDSIYDNTNYKLLKDYQDKLSELEPEEFKKYLVEKLINTNNMTENDAIREANAIILGKRLVVDGDYAILDQDIDVSPISESSQSLSYGSNESSSSKSSDSPSSESSESSESASTSEQTTSEQTTPEQTRSELMEELFGSPGGTPSSSTGGGKDELTNYYIRENDKWISSSNATEEFGNISTSDMNNKLLCNLQEKCITNSNDNCVSLESAENKIIENTLEQIQKEFDATYGKKDHDMRTEIDNLLLENVSRIQYLKKYAKTEQNRYDILKRNLANSITDEEFEQSLITSPYEEVKDLILGQKDELKKQHDIQRFILHFTRKPYEFENQYWLYCQKTNVKLLPTFIGHLANVYISQGDYQLELDIICAQQGTISDDGEAWIDKHSGYFIKKIDLDTEEGYTEEGFKLKTREVMEMDAGDKILEDKKGKEKESKEKKPESAESKIISNIISAMANNIGINLDDEKNFIIKNVISIHKTSIDSKETYNKKIKEAEKKGRKNIPTYEDYLNTSYIILTLVFILIAIQVSIPSIKTRKTFPGCIRTFIGYPLHNDNKSALTYIACIANKIKSSSKPWNSILKINQEKLITQMDAKIKKYILNNKSILKRFEEKRKYLQTETEDVILLEYDTVKLQTFYPPLFNFKIVGLTNVSDIFKNDLKKNIKAGSYNQQIQILSIKTKLILYGLSIQEKIQKIITKKIPLITNNAMEPYLENACCDSLSPNVHKYFIDIDRTLAQDNTISIELYNLLYDINILGKAAMYYDPIDTKQRYPEITSHFSKDTIYRAFIIFCSDNSLILNEQLRASCNLSTRDTYKLTIDEQIQKLKEDGIHYSEELFQKLLSIINLKNIVHININIIPQNPIHVLNDLLQSTELTETETIIPKEFINYFKDILDRYSFEATEDDSSVRDYKNYLSMYNIRLLEKIEKFIKENSSLSKLNFKHLINWFKNITEFIESGDNIYINSKDETTYKMMNFIKNSINDLVDIFPNIILNKIDKSNVSIPKHWKLSNRHNMDIQTFIQKYYHKLHKFYGDDSFNDILTNIQKKCKNIQLLAKHTPFFTSFKTSEREINSIFDNRLINLLYNFYFLSVIDCYIILLTSQPDSLADTISDELITESLVDPISDAIAEDDIERRSIEKEDIEIEEAKIDDKTLDDEIIEDETVPGNVEQAIKSSSSTDLFMETTLPIIKEIIMKDPSLDTLTNKSVRKELEYKMGLQEDSLRSKKKVINKLIDTIIKPIHEEQEKQSKLSLSQQLEEGEEGEMGDESSQLQSNSREEGEEEGEGEGEEEGEGEDLLQSGGKRTSGQSILIPSKLCELLFTFMEIISGNEKDSDKNIINYNYKTIMEKILRSKEKEKDLITEHLKDLTDEERKVENIMKNQKLDKWGKGLTKGVHQYVQDNYDDERNELEEQAIKEKKLGINSAVTDMNKDIYAFDLDIDDAIGEEIESEEYNMSGIPDDDDYGENDGDEYY